MIKVKEKQAQHEKHTQLEITFAKWSFLALSAHSLSEHQ